MKDLHMPHSYAAISETEQSHISGGGPLGDALDAFFGSLHMDDLFFGGGLISFSVSFVPMLLFNVVKTGFNFAMDLYNRFSDRIHLSTEGSEMMQFISSAREKDEQSPDSHI